MHGGEESLDLSKNILVNESFQLQRSSQFNYFDCGFSLESLPTGKTLMISLSVGSIFASIDFSINAAPSQGYLDISPSAGLEFVENFVFSALNWFDQDIPLRYSFGFLNFDGDIIRFYLYQNH